MSRRRRSRRARPNRRRKRRIRRQAQQLPDQIGDRAILPGKISQLTANEIHMPGEQRMPRLEALPRTQQFDLLAIKRLDFNHAVE
jgi:hypothetical protein